MSLDYRWKTCNSSRSKQGTGKNETEETKILLVRLENLRLERVLSQEVWNARWNA